MPPFQRAATLVGAAVILVAATWAQQKPKTQIGVKPDQPQQQPSLVSRYARMSCAVVQISEPSSTGTGVFINGDGDLLTAAHVVLNRSFSVDAAGDLVTTVTFKVGLQYRREGAVAQPVAISKPTPDDAERASADLAIVKTGDKTGCFIPLGDSDALKIGESVIAIGYPNLAPSGALYQGFISSRYKHLRMPMGFVGSRPVYPEYDVLRIQIPVTPGASGSPVIDEHNKIVGIISEVPVVWTNDLSELMQTMARQGGSGVRLSGFDTTLLLAKLAWIVQQFESPGAGLAIPISYLKPQASSK
jgi:S1-C subfamily serine protease